MKFSNDERTISLMASIGVFISWIEVFIKKTWRKNHIKNRHVNTNSNNITNLAIVNYKFTLFKTLTKL